MKRSVSFGRVGWLFIDMSSYRVTCLRYDTGKIRTDIIVSNQTIAQENKYLRIFFSYFIMELYVVCTH